ncbi:Serine/threonine-protein kinase chk-1 [Aphelenchoides besseyi]|nr:Serine/threonine-protein kinase chk-1 [Aphelenchoides besseyi]KAI6230934.1 Serine/threonine-protein kinase chk-1 [Aphelenchoides besseyi]
MRTIYEDEPMEDDSPERESSTNSPGNEDKENEDREDEDRENEVRDATVSSTLEVLMDLGEGSFGQVKLVYDKLNPIALMAVKVTNLKRNTDQAKRCRKEALIVRACREHPNVIRYLSMRINSQHQFQIFMEYADGGELFDQIGKCKPDVGMPSERARLFFGQLIEGLIYIHSKGICHLDIKPENLLLTKLDVLKIADFGFAAVYKVKNEEKLLTHPVGTAEYSDPCVFRQCYRGEFADVWSAGVVLAVMLTGDLPWDEPNRECYSYYEFVHKKVCTHPPWSRIGNVELSLLRSIFVENFEDRINLDSIKKHAWLADDSHRRAVGSPTTNFDYVSSSVWFVEFVYPLINVASSQPANFTSLSSNSSSEQTTTGVKRKFPRFGMPSECFSQPEAMDALIMTSSQAGENSENNFHPLQSFVRRMTRFCVSTDVADLLFHIEEACLDLGCSSSFTGPQSLSICANYRRRTVRYLVRIFDLSDANRQLQLVDARCSTGSGVDFKRAFAAFRNQVKEYIRLESDSFLRDLGLLPALPMDYTETAGTSDENSSNDV